jgi:serine/threonine-protein kinase
VATAATAIDMGAQMRGDISRAVYDETVELTGTLLGGRYRVGQVLGRGGMGVVYEAVQEGIDRPVALKVMYEHLASDASIRERFKREAKAVAMIRHPNVVQINDYIESKTEPPFLVMERLTGETLRDVMKRETISGERMSRIALQVLAALDAAHRVKIVHRDIKPDNIFLEKTTAQRDIVKLLDFGVSKFLGESDEAIKLTRMGHAIGTPSFMAPEQAVGDAVDGRSDLYALGATMFMALTGKKIYEVREVADLVRTIMTTVPPLVSTLRPDVHADLSRVIACALEKNASARYTNAMEMSRALSPFGKIPTSMNERVESVIHDTQRDPVVVENTAPMVVDPSPRVVVVPVQVQAQPMSVPVKSSTPLVAVAVGLSVLIVVGGGVGFAYSQGYIGRGAPAPARVAKTPQAIVTPLSQPGEIATLTPTATESAPQDSTSVAIAPTQVPPPPTMTTTATSPPASLMPTGGEPAECRAAKLMKTRGQERQAAQLALICMRKGGAPPF